MNGVTLPTTEISTWGQTQITSIQQNAKALNALFCALSPAEFDRISSCKTAKEVWDKLEVTHEGTNQVKESKINLLMHEYEMFSMSIQETISDMFSRFSKIVNSLSGFGKDITVADQVKKLLRSLPKNWTAKVTAIEEAKD
ncbi:retrotransposon gag domain-containing protein, partial [Escherichia coli]|uniref:retrotransposon gag domain-containing protein n=1 Tax=Escherichia coli TaxID=562 RepID=UPI00193930C1